MLEGVFLVFTGESVMVGSIALAVWTLVFVVGNLLYIPLVEEPQLAERFGDTYVVYKHNVPRWVPRLSSWKPESEIQEQSSTIQFSRHLTDNFSELVQRSSQR
jgi:hypothetical protein